MGLCYQIVEVQGFTPCLLQVVMSTDVAMPVRQAGKISLNQGCDVKTIDSLFVMFRIDLLEEHCDEVLEGTRAV